jgi:antitoxin component of RelBE/YafQ-DinJ toxin-antitoxin module
MSQVIYARVPDTVKEAADAYAEDRGVTLTSAVVDLLGRGLAAASDERSIADLESKLARASAEKAQSEANLAAAMSELGGLRAFAQRAVQAVGTCPNSACGQPITGYDLLAVGHCSHCEQTLMDLLAPRTSSSNLDQREIGLLLGALGVARVGAAIIGSAGR